MLSNKNKNKNKNKKRLNNPVTQRQPYIFSDILKYFQLLNTAFDLLLLKISCEV